LGCYAKLSIAGCFGAARYTVYANDNISNEDHKKHEIYNSTKLQCQLVRCYSCRNKSCRWRQWHSPWTASVKAAEASPVRH